MARVEHCPKHHAMYVGLLSSYGAFWCHFLPTERDIYAHVVQVVVIHHLLLLSGPFLMLTCPLNVLLAMDTSQWQHGPIQRTLKSIVCSDFYSNLSHNSFFSRSD